MMSPSSSAGRRRVLLSVLMLFATVACGVNPPPPPEVESLQELASHAFKIGTRAEAVGRYAEALRSLSLSARLDPTSRHSGAALKRVQVILSTCPDTCPHAILRDVGNLPEVMSVAEGFCEQLAGVDMDEVTTHIIDSSELENYGKGPKQIDVDDDLVFACEDIVGYEGSTVSWHIANITMENRLIKEGMQGNIVFSLSWMERTNPFAVGTGVLEAIRDMSNIHLGEFDAFEALYRRWVYSYVTARNAALRGDTLSPRAPPWDVPPEHLQGFSMGGRVRIVSSYFDESNDLARRNYAHGSYSEESAQIRKLIEDARNKMKYYYGETDTNLYMMLEKLGSSWFRDKDVVVMGSLIPWYEAVCIANGATRVSTIEYNRVFFEHPAIVRTYTVEEYFGMDEDDALNVTGERVARPRFDIALSISSFEHDGLGRYGDPVDPDGDLKAMRKMKQVLRPGGFLLFAAPCGEDLVKWNAHRKYGKVRLPHIFRGWKVLAQMGLTPEILSDPDPNSHNQPVWLLQNHLPVDMGQVEDLAWDELLAGSTR